MITNSSEFGALISENTFSRASLTGGSIRVRVLVVFPEVFGAVEVLVKPAGSLTLASLSLIHFARRSSTSLCVQSEFSRLCISDSDKVSKSS